MPQSSRNQCVATLVISRHLALMLTHQTRTLLRARHHTVNRLIDRSIINQMSVGTRRQQRGLIQNVRKISTRVPRCLLRDSLKVNPINQRLIARMHLKDLLTSRKIRRLNRHLTVKTARTQQGRIQNIRTVRRRNQDDVGVRIETIHLNQQLVQRLFTLIVTATDAGATLAAHRIDLINKNDRRRRTLSLLEQVTHAGGTHTNEHLNEIGTRNREERNPSLTGNSLSKQRLTGTRRAIQQNTARDLRPN